MKNRRLIFLVLCAAAAAIVAEALLDYGSGTYAEHGSPTTKLELFCDMFFVPGLFLAMVFMCSLPATHILMYGVAFILLFISFLIAFSFVSRLRRRDDA